MLVRDVAQSQIGTESTEQEVSIDQKPDTAHIGNRSVNDFAVHSVQAHGELDKRVGEVRNRRHLRKIHLIE